MLLRLLPICFCVISVASGLYAQNSSENQRPVFEAKDIYKLDMYGDMLKQVEQEFQFEGYKRDIFRVETLGPRPNFPEFFNVKIRMEYVGIGIGGVSLRNIIEFYGYYVLDTSLRQARLIGFDRMTIDHKEN